MEIRSNHRTTMTPDRSAAPTQNGTHSQATNAMTNVRARYINLTRSAAWLNWLECYLHNLKISGNYSQFPVIRGENKLANTMCLRASEQALQQSWIQRLQEELKKTIKDYTGLHIVQDDMETDRRFLMLCLRLKPGIPEFDVLTIDMDVTRLMN